MSKAAYHASIHPVHWLLLNCDRACSITSVAQCWDSSAAAAWGVGAAWRSRTGWQETSWSETVETSGTAPQSPPGCRSSDCNPVLYGLCRSWKCGLLQCFLPAVQDEALAIQKNTSKHFFSCWREFKAKRSKFKIFIRLMVQINPSLTNLILHSDSLWLMDASSYCIFLLTVDKVSACEVHTMTERHQWAKSQEDF